MKKIFKVIIIVGFIAGIFSCAHKRYAQKTVDSDIKTVATASSNIKQPYFLFISDIHLDIAKETTDSTTDTGLDLWKAFKTKIDSILGSSVPPAFVLCTGDLPAHYKCDTSCYLTGKKLQKHNDELSTVLTDLRNIVSKYKVPLYYVPGNNDGVSGDYYSFANGQQQTLFSLVPDPQNPYPALNVATTGTTAPYIISMPHSSMGYYAALAIPGLRIIALNSVILGNKYEPEDGVPQLNAGNEEMEWLGDQLKDAKAKGEKVYIAMHIPPGTDAYKFSHHKTPNTTWALLPSAENSWLKTFLGFAQDYQTTIAGIFYGHTHMDELRLLYDSTGSHVTEVAISAPGITPLHSNNPGFKTVSFDSVSKEPTDFTTYYTTLPVAATWGNSTYSFSTIFNSKPSSTIYDFLSSQNPDEINKNMDRIYTVINGDPAYDTNSGMIIKWK